MWGAVRFDFGTSMWSGKPVITEIATRLPVSLEIAVLATVVAVVDRDPARHDLGAEAEQLDRPAGATVSIAGIATPSFWLGIVSILLVLDITQAITGQPWMPPIDYVPLWKDPIAQPVDGDAAGDHRRLSLCRGVACA